ncbi:MAG: winged helix-turn-helix transcriptional regulator [Lachnospiraceae bacterium]|nr:winged helix-turn-helix transcriptional regulator [Lachnospiraceae bacterium]
MAKEQSIEVLYDRIMDEFEESYRFMSAYDAMPHWYGDSVLYQAESHTVEMIGGTPGITASELAARMGKTPSACSQIIRKMRKKDFVRQERNSENNREYNLFLTEQGWNVYKAHAAVDEECGRRKLEKLSQFSCEELEIYLKIHRLINQEFEVDVRQAQDIFETLQQMAADSHREGKG